MNLRGIAAAIAVDGHMTRMQDRAGLQAPVCPLIPIIKVILAVAARLDRHICPVTYSLPPGVS